jgi:hypothetical protein
MADNRFQTPEGEARLNPILQAYWPVNDSEGSAAETRPIPKRAAKSLDLSDVPFARVQAACRKIRFFAG